MSMRAVNFELFGIKYRSTQFSAVEGFDILDGLSNVHPLVLLGKSEILLEGKWLAMDAQTTNKVKDMSNALPPNYALKAVLSTVSNINFGFIDSWRRINVPSRFISDTTAVKADGVSPIVAALVQAEVASLRELEEYYSLEDAYRMFDVVMAKAVNSLLGQEEAEREAKSR